MRPGGTLSRLYPLYEERESQVAMLRLVCKSFNGDELCAAEAGTGVGKSLAYLLPAIAWALRNKERVVVSTNTINLQQQLMDKDIPLVKRILGEDPKVVLVKGRRNYLCLHRLNETLDELSLFEESDPEILAIREWARTTETGSRTDLSFFPSEESWSRVCSEADACLGLRCSHREGCFVLKARREASSAQVLVANHHLLFSDLAFRLAGSGFDDPAVLPPFRRVVFDEAHNIEKAATSFFSQSFSRFALQRFLGRLHRRVERGSGSGAQAASGRGRDRSGHLATLSRVLGESALTGKAPRLVDDIREKAEELDRACLELMGEESAILLDAGNLPRLRRSRVGPALAALAAVHTAFRGPLRRAFRQGGGKGQAAGHPEHRSGTARCSLPGFRESRSCATGFGSAESGRNDIFWLERIKGRPVGTNARLRKKKTKRAFVITPLDIGPLMKEAVFEPIRTAVFTSATSDSGGRVLVLGGEDRPRQGRGKGAASSDLPVALQLQGKCAPRRAHGCAAAGCAPATSRFSRASSRGPSDPAAAPASFSSPRIPCFGKPMRTCSPCWQARGIRILKQGDDERSRLLDAFRAERSSVLFATDSFWEGVDAPGETLQMVILCRLPFRVPTEPVLKAGWRP